MCGEKLQKSKVVRDSRPFGNCFHTPISRYNVKIILSWTMHSPDERTVDKGKLSQIILEPYANNSSCPLPW